MKKMIRTIFIMNVHFDKLKTAAINVLYALCLTVSTKNEVSYQWEYRHIETDLTICIQSARYSLVKKGTQR